MLHGGWQVTQKLWRSLVNAYGTRAEQKAKRHPANLEISAKFKHDPPRLVPQQIFLHDGPQQLVSQNRVAVSSTQFVRLGRIFTTFG